MLDRASLNNNEFPLSLKLLKLPNETKLFRFRQLNLQGIRITVEVVTMFVVLRRCEIQ